MSQSLKFECPKCHHHIIEQVASDCTVSTKIKEITDIVDYACDNDIESSSTARFQCSYCGWPIPGIENDEDLIEWLTNNQDKSFDIDQLKKDNALLLDALVTLQAAFIHDGNGKTKGNKAKTDVIKYNEDVRLALVKARETMDYKLGK